MKHPSNWLPICVFLILSLSLAPRAFTQDHLTILATAQRSVVQLKMKTADREVFATGTAFLVAEGGVAVTNLHVLQNATFGTATLSDDVSQELRFDILSVVPTLDLAIIKLDLDPRIRANLSAPAPLPVRSDDPVAGEDVWAIGYPKGLGITITKGIVNAVRTCDELPSYLCKGRSNESRWIQTDCTINSGNSGGPLIDSRGRLVGVTTWVWLEGQNMFFALSSRHVSEAMNNITGDAISLTELARVTKTEQFSARTFPSLEVPHRVHPQALKNTVVQARSLFECRTCKGEGTIVERKTVRKMRRDGRSWRMGEDVTLNCSTCQGVGIGDDRRIKIAIEKIVPAIVELNREDESAPDALSFAGTDLVDAWQERAQPLENVLYGLATEVLSGQCKKIGTPVMLVGRIANDWHFEHDHLWLVSVRGRTVLVSDPQAATVLPGELALLGGYFAGYMTFEDGSTMPVVQHGFLFN